MINAQFGDRVIPSQLDTGAEIATWPMSLNLKGAQYILRSDLNVEVAALFGLKYEDVGIGAFGESIPAHPTVLPSVRFGGFEAKNVESFALDMAHSVKSKASAEIPLLPGTLFEDMGLTIDYERRELVIYPEGYADRFGKPAAPADVADLLDKDEAHVLTFRFDDENNVTGRPVLLANIEGIPVHLILDTGWCDSTVGLGKNLYETLKQRRASASAPTKETNQRDINLLGTDVSVERLADVTTILPASNGDASPYQVTTDAEEMLADEGRSDGVIGWGFLRHFRRVTFDFGKRKIYFEPWTAGSVQDRTGIFANPAMLKTSERRLAASCNGVPLSVWDSLFGKVIGTASSAHYVSTYWTGGVTGDLWDDGTFIPAAFPPPIGADLLPGDAGAAAPRDR